MDKDQSHVTEGILDLTLEIIYLLTGEEYTVVKKISGEPLTPSSCRHGTSPITVPPPEKQARKILEATKKIIKLVTGEVPIKWQDVTVSVKGYLEGHKDLYKDVMMDNQPPLTSPDGSSNGNPPERCPRPLYSHRDPTQEGLTIPHHHQGEKLKGIKVEVKKEEEEMLVSEAQQFMEKEKMIMESKQEESSLYIDTSGCYAWNVSEGRPFLSPDYNVKYNNSTQHFPGVNVLTQTSQRSMDPSNLPESSDPSHTVILRSEGTERSSDPSNPSTYEGAHTAGSSLSCPGCGKRFTNSSDLYIHQRMHTDEHPYSCLECGKCFSKKEQLLTHKRTHTSERPFACSQCEKCFSKKERLLIHQRNHTGERPFSCSECEKSFFKKGDLANHQRIHSGVRPYSCPVCGRGFNLQSNCVRHLRTHTGDHLYLCSECGKRFTDKRSLMKHHKHHMGERP